MGVLSVFTTLFKVALVAILVNNFIFAKFLGISGKDTKESVQNFINAVKQLNKDLNIPSSIKEAGVNEQEFLSKLDMLAENAHDDQCTGANPRYPLVEEIKEIFKKAYYGE